MAASLSLRTANATAIPLSERARQRLVEELHVLRVDCAHRLAAHARQLRDSDAELTDPHPDVAVMERRMGQIEQVLARCVVVADAEPDGETVLIGSRVRVRWDGGEEEQYEIMSPGQAGRRLGQISCEAPLGRALLGQRAGNRVAVAAPAGLVHLTLQDVEQAPAQSS